MKTRTHVHGFRAGIAGMALLLAVSGCGGGGGGGGASPPPPPATTFAVGGSVAGLAGTGLVLQNNGGDDLTITADGAFSFSQPLNDGAAYAVTVARQPTNLSQTCAVANGSGIIAGADVTDVAITCVTDRFTIGGQITGLTGSGLVLQLNGGMDLSVGTNGAFAFGTDLEDGTAYRVTVQTQPAGQTCSVANGTGILAGNDVAGVTVTCVDVGSSHAGELDTTFGNNGIVIHADAGGSTLADERGAGIAIDDQDRIVIVGNGRTGNGMPAMIVWRFNADGTLDTTFGDYVSGTSGPRKGFLVRNNTLGGIYGEDVGRAVAIDSQGRIVVAGEARTTADADLVVWRFNPDGTDDDTFGAFVSGTSGPRQGYVSHGNAAGGAGDDTGFAVVIDGSDRILVAGSSFSGLRDPAMVVWRFTADGVLDSSFGDDVSGSAGPRKGFLVQDNVTAGAWDVGVGIRIDGQGRILVAGSSGEAFLPDLVVWRFTPDGALDDTYGDFVTGTAGPRKGFVVLSNANGGNFPAALALDAMERAVVTGSRDDVTYQDMAVWRLQAVGEADGSWGGQGRVTHDNAAGGSYIDAGMAIAITAAGNILIAGYSDNGTDFDMVLWRYLPDGQLDTAFGDFVTGSSGPRKGYAVQTDTAGGSGTDSGNGVAIDSQGRILVTGSSVNPDGNADMVVWCYLP